MTHTAIDAVAHNRTCAGRAAAAARPAQVRSRSRNILRWAPYIAMSPLPIVLVMT